MTLTANQVSAAKPRRERLLKTCAALPEVAIEPRGDGHIAFRIRRKIFAYYLFESHDDGLIAFC